MSSIPQSKPTIPTIQSNQSLNQGYSGGEFQSNQNTLGTLGAANQGSISGQQPNKAGAGTGLDGLTDIPSLGFEVGASAKKEEGLGDGAYVPSFQVGGASRRPRRMLGR